MAKPDYTLNALDKDTDLRGQVGAAWKQPDGSIRVSFNPFIDPAKLLTGSVVLSLFPTDRPAAAPAAKTPAKQGSLLGESVPF